MKVERDQRGIGFVKLSVRRLGRRHARDDRDRRYLVRPAVPAAPSYRFWFDNGWWGDQGLQPHCVGYAWAHYIEDSPKTHPEPGAFAEPSELYSEAQRMDEWPGEDYEGTSVRAGAKALLARGLVAEYRWAFTLQDVINILLTQGPVVVGTNWYESMFRPVIRYDAQGHPRVTLPVKGDIAGGHAYILNGVNVPAQVFRMKNSWGREWGVDGRASISFSDFDRLLSEDGEACLTVERSPELTPI